MKRLFVIGNGFDLAHNLPTDYSYFKKYLVDNYPNYTKEYDGLIETQIGNHGEWVFDMNDLVGAIIYVIDEIDSEYLNQKGYREWNLLEKHVGMKYAYTILDHHSFFLHNVDWENMEDSYDKERRNAIYNNEDISRDLELAYTQLKELFNEWVRECFANFSFDDISKIKTPSFKDSLLLNFNYTSTLEDVYGVDYSNICYIHGYAKDYNSKIIFGHGKEDEEFEVSDRYYGAEDSFRLLIRETKKDTYNAYINNVDFFNKLESIEEIYSFGFSFSDVDLDYIYYIRSRINLEKVVWYFNNHDCKNNRDGIDKIAKMGFKTKKTDIW